jgi:RND superfamily putative drug exporter
MRRPLLVAIPVLAILLVAGSPFLGIQLSTGQNLADLPPVPSRIGFEVIEDNFPGGESDPIAAVMTWEGVDLDGSLSAERQAAIAEYTRFIRSMDPKVNAVESALTPPPGMTDQQYLALLAQPQAERPAALNEYVAAWVAGDTTKLRVFSKYVPDSDDGRALVDKIRAISPPEGTQVLTGGLPSRSADFMRSFRASVPIAILIVVLVTSVVLFLTFGSVFLPVKAVLMSLISVTASFGALVWIFQEGHLRNLLGFETSHTIGAWEPIIMFAILFGLSMDYEVLLLSRIRERYLATGDNTRAVAEGIGITGGMITGAALIMVAVFAAFGMSSITSIKALGVTMSLAVLIDATIVRGLLVPAFMRIMGRVNWWAPAWLQRGVARLGLYEIGSQAADASVR